MTERAKIDVAINVVEADFARTEHQQAICAMLDAYSRDPMGNAAPLPDDVLERLVPALRDHPTCVVLLAFDGKRPVGIATCFQGMSTFVARRLLNLHDLAVIPEYRGRGVGRLLLAAVEEKARELGCCKVTLEVLEENPARAIYEASGYGKLDYGNGAGRSLFLTKPL
jgi:GNAT superfamily N-acetyltransferase